MAEERQSPLYLSWMATSCCKASHLLTCAAMW